MNVLGVILSRAASKGLPDKCVRGLLGRPVIAYTFRHALDSARLTDVVLTTDSEPAKKLAREFGIEVIDRPAELAGDTATVDAAARHAVEIWEARRSRRADLVVLLYGNIPVRAPGLIDRAVDLCFSTSADSVRSVAPLTKHHPDWSHRVHADARMTQYRANSIYRRQDLEPLYYHDGAVVVVTREALFDALRTPDDHQAFLGRDRRALIQSVSEAVDIDEPLDLLVAEALLRAREAAAAPASCSAQVRIGSRVVGEGSPVYVIAEAGVNHDGDLDKALALIATAARAGADAVKFQMFRAADLVTSSAPPATYQRQAGGTSQRRMLERLELSTRDFQRLRDRCAECGLDFVATPFSLPDLARLVELKPAAIKIASTDLRNLPLLEAAAATGFPLILSTGASTEAEIGDAFSAVSRAGARSRLILLHCVSCYPTPLADLNLGAIRSLQERFHVPAGLSDHTVELQTGAWAAVAGARTLEKHFTLDRAAAGPDHAMSLTPGELKEYVGAVRLAESALGTGRLGMNLAEAEVRRIAGKSVVSAQFIPAGTCVTATMLTVKRPGGGVAPADLGRVAGRTAAVDIPADTLISWDMVRQE